MALLDSTSTEVSGGGSVDPQGRRTVEGITIGLGICALLMTLCMGIQGAHTRGVSLAMFDGLGIFSTLAFALAGSYWVGRHFRIDRLTEDYHTILRIVAGGILTGVGGGVMRDLIAAPLQWPVLFTDLSLFPAAALGAVLGLQLSYHPDERIEIAINTMDSIAVAVAVVVGVSKSHAMLPDGTPGALNCMAVVCAWFTACGGGVLRDLMVRRTPTIFTGIAVVLPIVGALGHNVLVAWTGIDPIKLWIVVVPVLAVANMYLNARRFPNVPR